MATITIQSQKYPAIGLIVSERPTIGGPGAWEFAMGQPYTVSDAVVGEIREQIASFRPAVREVLRVEVQADTAPAATQAAGAVDAPKPPPDPTSTTVEPEDDAIAFTDDDQELIQVEVDKLLAKATIAEREPLLNATAGNENFPMVLRKAYLEAVIAAEGMQQKLVATAKEWLELLAA